MRKVVEALLLVAVPIAWGLAIGGLFDWIRRLRGRGAGGPSAPRRFEKPQRNQARGKQSSGPGGQGDAA